MDEDKDKLLRKLYQLGDWISDHITVHHADLRSFANKKRLEWLNASNLEGAIDAIEGLAYMLTHRLAKGDEDELDESDEREWRINEIQLFHRMYRRVPSETELSFRVGPRWDDQWVLLLWDAGLQTKAASRAEVLFYLWKYYEMTGNAPHSGITSSWLPTIEDIKAYFTYKTDGDGELYQKVLARVKQVYGKKYSFEEAIKWGIVYLKTHDFLPTKWRMTWDLSMPDPRMFPIKYKDYKEIVLEEVIKNG
jgi:hypothetical protein